MEGPVTFGLVTVCFLVSSVVISIFVYFISRFQTKAEAIRVEDGLKVWIQKVEADVSKVQTSLERISENVSYIRGRIEPKTSQGGKNEAIV